MLVTIALLLGYSRRWKKHMKILNSFINLKVSKKLFFGFSAVLLITAAILTTGLFGLFNVGTR